MMDANQIWSVSEAIHNMKALAKFKPLWIEEPTAPDGESNIQKLNHSPAFSLASILKVNMVCS